MTHPLVTQLHFARSELVRGLEGVTDAEARRRILPMNCISWIIGHLAGHEQRCWLEYAQGVVVAPRVYELTDYGLPATTPPLDDMWADWQRITREADAFLETLTARMLLEPVVVDGEEIGESVGTFLLRVIYHYWFHIGEAQAIRQMLGHTNLPDFVGDVGTQAPYRPDP